MNAISLPNPRLIMTHFVSPTIASSEPEHLSSRPGPLVDMFLEDVGQAAKLW